MAVTFRRRQLALSIMVLAGLLAIFAYNHHKAQEAFAYLLSEKGKHSLTTKALAPGSSSLNLSDQERAWLAAHPVIRVGIDRNFSPYEWIDRQGNYRGIAADHLRLLEQRLGVSFELVQDKKSWGEVLTAAQRGEVDMLSCLVKTPARENYLTFSSPYITSYGVIVSELANGYIGGLEQLVGKHVAIHKGHFTRELLQRDFPGIKLITTANITDALRLVAEGKADAFVGDASAASFSMNQEGLLNLTFSGHTPYKSEFRLAVLKRHSILRNILDKALASLSEEEKQALFHSWRGLKVQRGVQPGAVTRYSLFGLLLLMIFAYWILRLRQEVRIRKRAELREHAHSQALEQLSQGAPLSEVLSTILCHVEQENPRLQCSILLLDSDGKRLHQVAARSLPESYTNAIDGMPIDPSACSCGAAAFSGERVVVEDIQSHPFWVDHKELAAASGLASCWSEPIKGTSGRILGTFAIYRNKVSAPTDAEIQLIENVSSLAAIAIERSQAINQIWAKANLDPLTKLPNRSMFLDRLDQELKKAQRAHQQVALLFLDLDHFKEINDNLGHDMGDLLLCETADRLCRCVREADTVARLGGDEFTIILGGLDDGVASVERVANKVLEQLSQPFQLRQDVGHVSTSIGITLYPKDATERDMLLKNADQAMYVAKQQGRDRLHFFTPSLQEEVMARTELIKELRWAIADNQFQLHYQPIIDLTTGQIAKAEALIRWQHPDKGQIGPADFIPIAEETGMINDIGRWVLNQATDQADYWRHHYQRDFQISINTSPAQFRDEKSHLVEWIEQLRRLNLGDDAVVVEITESLLMNASEPLRKTLLAFRDAGIQVALDDFGTGYSSLSYLREFDIDYLKIDRSFVKGLTPGSNDLVLCKAVIAMAHILGIKVVAEGIETETQRQLLTAAGCDYGQGFLFSKPVSVTELESMIRNHISLQV